MKQERTLKPNRIPILAASLSRRFGVAFELTSLEVECSRPVFRAVGQNGTSMFVKITSPEEAARTLDFLRASGACGLLPRPLCDEPLEFDGRSIVCLEWKSGRRLEVEDMTDAEADSFLAGIVELSAALRSAPDVQAAAGEDTPIGQYATISNYARQHSLVAHFLAALISVPVEERDYGTRTLSPIHGDMHSCNFGFDGGRMTSVFDFDSLIMGLPCEDAVYPFTESIRQHGLPREKRLRLRQTFHRLSRMSPWPLIEWRIAVNHARFRIAANRIRKHPKSPLTAIDVAHRDYLIRPLLEELK